MIHEIAERLDEVIGRWPESYACERVDEVHNGFEWTDFYRSDIDPSYHITPEQTRIMESRSENCWQSWCEENDVNPDTRYDELTDEQSNDYAEYENEWFEPALLRLTIQDDHVFLSINYTDQPYYRYQYDEPILKIPCEKTVDLTIQAMQKAFNDHVEECSKS